MQVIATLRLARGQVGFYDPLTKLHFTIANSQKDVRKGMNTTNLKAAVKSGRIILVSGSLDAPETNVQKPIIIPDVTKAPKVEIVEKVEEAPAVKEAVVIEEIVSAKEVVEEAVVEIKEEVVEAVQEVIAEEVIAEEVAEAAPVIEKKAAPKRKKK